MSKTISTNHSISIVKREKNGDVFLTHNCNGMMPIRTEKIGKIEVLVNITEQSAIFDKNVLLEKIKCDLLSVLEHNQALADKDKEIAELKQVEHPDDDAVNFFAKKMKEKMKKSREKGRRGWDECSPQILSKMLHEHILKGDPIDVANFCMMLFMNGHKIESSDQSLTIRKMQVEIEELRKFIVKPWNDKDVHYHEHSNMYAHSYKTFENLNASIEAKKAEAK